MFSANKIKEEKSNVQVGTFSRISWQCLVQQQLLLKANIYYPLQCTQLKWQGRQQILELLCTMPTAIFLSQPSLSSFTISSLCRIYSYFQVAYYIHFPFFSFYIHFFLFLKVKPLSRAWRTWFCICHTDVLHGHLRQQKKEHLDLILLLYFNSAWVTLFLWKHNSKRFW